MFIHRTRIRVTLQCVRTLASPDEQCANRTDAYVDATPFNCRYRVPIGPGGNKGLSSAQPITHCTAHSCPTLLHDQLPRCVQHTTVELRTVQCLINRLWVEISLFQRSINPAVSYLSRGSKSHERPIFAHCLTAGTTAHGCSLQQRHVGKRAATTSIFAH